MNDRLTHFAIRLLAATTFGFTAFTAAGCASSHEASADESFGRLGIVASAVTSQYAITSIVVTSGTATATLSYDSTKGKYTGAIVLPAGQQTITAKAYAGADAVGQGTANVTIEANKIATLNLRVLDTTGGQSHVDAGPYIVSLATSSSTPVTGQPVTLSLNALDAESDPLTYAWSSSCGGTFSSPSGATTTWQSDAAGPCKITATATSNSLSASDSLDLVVFTPSSQQGGAAVNVDYVPNPTIESISVFLGGSSVCWVSKNSTNSLCPTALAKTELTISMGVSVYAGSTIALTDDCGGTVHEVGTGYFTYQPGTGLCTLKATITNGDGLSSSLSASVYVKPS